jgi:transposase
VKVYQMSDGTATSVAIAKAANVSQSLVSRLWKRWRQMGIAENAEGGRTIRSFSLDAFGIAPESTESKESEL